MEITSDTWEASDLNEEYKVCNDSQDFIKLSHFPIHFIFVVDVYNYVVYTAINSTFPLNYHYCHYLRRFSLTQPDRLKR
jgi:hypothetical protein